MATLAAFETSPSAAAAARRLQVASLFVVGSDDRIFPAMRTARMFRGAPLRRSLPRSRGGSHCGFQDKVPPACDARGRISYTRQRALTRKQLRRWLGRYLKGTPGAPVTGVQGISYTQR